MLFQYIFLGLLVYFSISVDPAGPPEPRKVPRMPVDLESMFDKSGPYNYNQISKLWKMRGLNEAEIIIIYKQMDLDNNDIISLGEYVTFHKFFIIPYETADADLDFFLNEKEIVTMLGGTNFFFIFYIQFKLS